MSYFYYYYDHCLTFTSIVNLIESIGETMQMANEDVQSQHVVTVNRSKVMLGTSDFDGAPQEPAISGAN